MRRKTTLALAAVAALGLTVGAVAPASAHGYVDSPPSRAYNCEQGVVQDCGPIQWEPQSVEGPKGFPAAGPADGTICAGGDARWAPLDDPRGGAWPATPVTGGQDITFTWHLTAAHSTTSFRYFVTNDGWDPGQPLTRADLGGDPFLEVDYDGAHPPADLSHTGTLPVRHGRQMILAVWDIADTGNAFYQCIDVDFGS
jgi:chitin-binding protein